MQQTDINKLYYSISEVSNITGLKQYVLRYWETEFNQLNPNKNSAGNRNYRAHDVDLILNIKSLLYDQKFTIKGAKQFLRDSKQDIQQRSFTKKIVKLTNTEDLEALSNIQIGLNELIDILDKYKD